MTLLLRKGRNRSSKNRFGSCSSRTITHANTFDADVDNIDIEKIEFNSGDDAAATSDNDDDAGIFSIVNGNASEREDTLAEEENDLLAVRTKRTEKHIN